MPTSTPWTPRLAAFGVALLLAASVVFWVLRWPVPDSGKALPLPMASDELPAASASAVARLLGAQAAAVEASAAPEASSRFRLIGIAAQGGGQGAALVSVDGKPARTYRRGSVLDEGWVLQAVQPRSIDLGAKITGPAQLTLELPKR